MKGFLPPNRDIPPDLNTQLWTRPEVRIVATYLIAASTWIVVSDYLLDSAAVNHGASRVIQSVKGIGFVLATALLLFFVLRWAFAGWRLAEQRRRVVIEHSRERFRALSSHLQNLREEDRIQIAREIHDELGQLLTGIKMEVRLLENRLADRDDRTLNPCIDKLVEISELVDGTITSVQNISSGLRPSALDNQGLGTALIDEAEQFSQRSGIACSIVVEDSPDTVPPEIGIVAFRIFQEALTNVARHADARRIDSTLSVEGNVLKLMIHDDGKDSSFHPRQPEIPRLDRNDGTRGKRGRHGDIQASSANGHCGGPASAIVKP